ncbi:MAG: DUF2975 domain-containing protein [Clostridia bacterium]|nr:DUF2975 domain-containing protein [Clostridia bacterium]
MFKISNKISINISLAVAALFMIACIVGAFIMPPLVEMLINLPDNIGNRGDITEGGRALVLVMAYLMLAVLMLADIFMVLLLLRVKKGLVFTEKSIIFIRAISWCCFAIALVFCVLGIYFQLSFILAFFAIFLGISLRVVKNVIEEATLIKSENDLTV